MPPASFLVLCDLLPPCLPLDLGPLPDLRDAPLSLRFRNGPCLAPLNMRPGTVMALLDLSDLLEWATPHVRLRNRCILLGTGIRVSDFRIV